MPGPVVGNRAVPALALCPGATWGAAFHFGEHGPDAGRHTDHHLVGLSVQNRVHLPRNEASDRPLRLSLL